MDVDKQARIEWGICEIAKHYELAVFAQGKCDQHYPKDASIDPLSYTILKTWLPELFFQVGMAMEVLLKCAILFQGEFRKTHSLIFLWNRAKNTKIGDNSFKTLVDRMAGRKSKDRRIESRNGTEETSSWRLSGGKGRGRCL